MITVRCGGMTRNYARHVERPVKCGDSDVAGGVHNVATYGVI